MNDAHDNAQTDREMRQRLTTDCRGFHADDCPEWHRAEVIIESYSDSPGTYIYHPTCFVNVGGVQGAVYINRVVCQATGNLTYEARPLADVVDDRDGQVPICDVCLEDIRP